MQCSIHRPVLDSAGVVGDSVAVSGHEDDLRGTFSIHFESPEAMMRFGRIIIAEGEKLVRNQRANSFLSTGGTVNVSDLTGS